jgi:hypothetical protein
MSTIAQTFPSPLMRRITAARALHAALVLWCSLAVLGQLIFIAYVTRFYGGAALKGEFERWNKVLPHGYVVGDPAGNLVVGVHLVFTVLIVVGGALQLLPLVRSRWPVLHRWNGRVFAAGALVLALSGLLMVWTRGAVGGWAQHIAISGNALLIMLCALMAVRHARARRFDLHRRWALRLWLAVGGVWFFRIGLMAWLMIHRAPVGFDPKTFEGPFLVFLSFAQYLLPLLVLEGVLRAQRGAAAGPKALMAGVVLAATALTALGITGAAMMMWLPRM